VHELSAGEIAMFGSILAIFATGVIVVASFFVLWGLAQARTGLFGQVLLFALVVLELVALTSSWIWAMKWRTLGFASPWRFVAGPRPVEPEQVSAWTWGRRAWLAWLAIVICMLAFVLTQASR
jgi:hypothetical protein